MFNRIGDYLFSVGGYSPHGMCLAWDSSVLYMHVFADLLIFVSYMSIPVGIYYFVRKRKDLAYRNLFGLFALFILACGFTHFVSIITLWEPVYGFQGVLKSATGIISLLTATMMIPVIPKALALPSPAALQAVNSQLTEEIAQREQAERDLRKAYEDIERRVEERTRDLVEANLKLENEIAERRLSEQELEVANSRFNDLTTRTKLGVAYVDRDLTIREANFPYAQLVGSDNPESLEGRSVLDWIGTEREPAVRDFFTRVFREGSARREVRYRRIFDTSQTFIDVEVFGAANHLGQDPVVMVMCRDITQRKEVERRLFRSQADLRIARDAAQNANTAKSSFLAQMSHELRTPLNSIMGFAEVVRDRRLGESADEKYSDYVAEIHRSGGQLLSLINDLLDLSAIEAGEFPFDPKPVDLPTVIGDAAKSVTVLAERKNILLEIDTSGAVDGFVGDHRALRQVVLNLLSNAVKYTEDAGRVTVHVSAQAERFDITVSDTGIGIAPDDIAKALRPFGQVENVMATAEQRTGLGLTIVQSLLDLHDGELLIESEPGVGTRVTARFPRKRDDDPSRR